MTAWVVKLKTFGEKSIMRQADAKKNNVAPLYWGCFLPRMAHLKINITYRCDRGCPNCNRATKLCPSSVDEDLNPYLLAKMLEKCVSIGKQWTHITLTGGEPTMHDKFGEFVDILSEYKKTNKMCTIETYTYHHPKYFYKIEDALAKHPEFMVRDTNKEVPRKHRWAIHKAPLDFPNRFPPDHFYVGCNDGARMCGLGWDASGFYCCPIGASIARVFGFRRSVPIKDIADVTANKLIEQYPVLCSRCGQYPPFRAKKSEKDIISPTWSNAIEDFKWLKTLQK